MTCPLFFQRGARCRCLAIVGEGVPTLHEREAFCSSGRHGNCPTLLTRLRTGRPLSESEYVELWTGEVAPQSAAEGSRPGA